MLCDRNRQPAKVRRPTAAIQYCVCRPTTCSIITHATIVVYMLLLRISLYFYHSPYTSKYYYYSLSIVRIRTTVTVSQRAKHNRQNEKQRKAREHTPTANSQPATLLLALTSYAQPKTAAEQARKTAGKKKQTTYVLQATRSY